MTEPIHKQRPGGRSVFDRSVVGITLPAQPEPALEIAPGVYQSDGMSNSWLLVTPEGRIVINAGMGFEGAVHRQKYDAVDSGPIRYLIFTQGHVDHVGGAEAFLEEGTEMIAHAGNQGHQALDQLIQGYRMRRSAFAFPQVRAYLEGRSGEAGQPAAVQAAPEPDITFEDRYSFSLGGLDLELMWVPGGETNDSIIIWLPQARIAIVGNLYGALFGHVPNLVTIRGDKYRESQVFSAAIERVRALEPEILAVGHHASNLALLAGRGIETREAAAFRAGNEPRADLVVEATGSATALPGALAATRPRGTLVLKTTVAERPGVDLAPIVIDEIQVLGSRCGPFEPALAALAGGDVDVSALVEERFPLARGVEAMQRAARRGARKVLLDCAG